MAGIKIVDLPALGRDLAATDLLELSLAGGTGSRKITGQEIINASKLNVGTTPIINGAVGQVLFQGTGNVLQESANLFWDNTNARLGIGVTNPSQKLSIVGNNFLMFTGVSAQNMPSYIGTDSSDNFYVYSAGQGSGKSAYYGPSSGTHLRTSSGSLDLFVGNGAPILGLRLNSTGNVLINTTTDAGFKLDVNGTARVQSGVALNSSNTTFQVTGASSSLFRIRGFGDVYLEGSTPAIFYGSSGTFVGGGSANFYSGQGTGNAFFSVVHNNSNVAIRALSNSNVLLNPSAGNVLIGSTTDDGFRLDVNGTARVSGNFNIATGFELNFNNQNVGIYRSANNLRLGGFGGIEFLSSATTISAQTIRMTLFNTGNFAINTTTDAGFRLDVNGTARVFGILTIGDNVQGKISADNQYLNLYHNGGSQSILSFGFGSSIGASGYLRINQNAGDPAGTTSGTIHRYDFNSTITNSTGTAQWNFQSLRPNYNFTGTYSGTVRGFYYNPTLTSMTGVTHFAFHSTSGRVRFEGLPTSPTGLNAGDLWNDAGTLRIV